MTSFTPHFSSGWPSSGSPGERLNSQEAGGRSPERSVAGGGRVPTVREREGEDRADWSPRRGRREILGGPRPANHGRVAAAEQRSEGDSHRLGNAATKRRAGSPGQGETTGSYRRKSRASMTVIHVPTWMPTIHPSRSSIPAIRVVRSSNRLPIAEKRAVISARRSLIRPAKSVRRSSSRRWTSSIRFESSPSFIVKSTLSCRLATVKHARAARDGDTVRG